MWLSDKKILITGGTGTIGKALLNRLLLYDINHIYIFSRDEQKQESDLYYFKQNPKVSFIIGDIRNYDSINSALRGVDIVFHTAAMKIVGICENNPYESLTTNVIGTENIIKSATLNNVEKVIFTSSDKAANPTTVMGIGKLYSERLISQANYLMGNSTIFTTVRFGNVFGSRGCVLDLFKKQIQKQNFLTVTHPAMTRFICTIDDAVELLIKSSEIAIGGEIIIKKMPSIKIVDLAEVLIEYLAPKYSKDPKNIGIKITKKQASEKLFEELVTTHEAERAFEFDEYYSILPTIISDRQNIFNLSKGKPVLGEISSDNDVHLTKDELLAFLIKSQLI
ncbi:polysaccharide biosynthesis protein [Clostridium cellulovorans]|uniref:Polysaccharide biosynthesis protein CapD n=1 Tax=Clostridium cellulovorans (strain ATCC 35296 / DSM 3052 / OCM 3 / 743B) TaxID=573061 RepID=D9SLY1_CLOC7|nr:polysaccharide biosynthesis protein [Clostridium cellulovorans]ADL51712.1 polysaccharide biosynthesis protein CapD [Clostridium cellulovorans 743B]